MKKILALLLFTSFVHAQSFNAGELSFSEYLGYVKKFHPLVKNANLQLDMAQANLMMARGAFDPKIEVDFDKKRFNGKEYYSLLNSTFKVPTWYGIELKAAFDDNDGPYINPENTVPESGLTSVGLSVPLGQGLFTNQRMADLRKAKLQITLSRAERRLQAAEVLSDAAAAYFEWRKSYSEFQMYRDYLKNADIRYTGIRKLIDNGDRPAVDSVEAGIVVRSRQLNVEDAKLKLEKARLELSTFLWLDRTPVELSEAVQPEENILKTVTETLNVNQLAQQPDIETHPKIDALKTKIALLDVERKLKANALLPKIDLGYYYLSERANANAYGLDNYKLALNFTLPILLRKERGSLKMTKFKIQQAELELALERLQLTNKIAYRRTEIESLRKQQEIIARLVADNTVMLQSEERLFSVGESSLFLINSRENNLISAQLSRINAENRFLLSNAGLFRIMASQTE
ncbi:transporter [Flavobacterium magnum]|uniref:Transporter n=1 Tax=Flavobacterium magnum TaxID=2162713 RepID=A0A2S0RF70_9FLAO|nr:TolC family protein [Flavobacterium magnum]AWA30326.1 transporter [Flavobacterium magnum]